MNIEQLTTILDFANVKKDRKIWVQVESNGVKQNCEIVSFETYSDGIVLHVTAFND